VGQDYGETGIEQSRNKVGQEWSGRAIKNRAERNRGEGVKGWCRNRARQE
jgi:hypothetical protein